MKDCSERLQYQKRKSKKEVMIQTKELLPFESSDISDFFFFLSYFSPTTGMTTITWQPDRINGPLFNP